jgi:hypothetical protein
VRIPMKRRTEVEEVKRDIASAIMKTLNILSFKKRGIPLS